VVPLRALSVMFNVNAMPVCDAIIACGCGRCYLNSMRSLVIVSLLVLRLKAAESFLETSRCT